MPRVRQVKETAKGIRTKVLEYVIANNGGYLSQALSSAEIFASLFTEIMNLLPVPGPITPAPFPGVPSSSNTRYFRGTGFLGARTPETDRFILSPTHYSLVLYAALIQTGRMAESGLRDFNRDGSSVEMIGGEHSPGMEVMTGSLGQGLAQAAGIALGRKMKGETGKVWVFMSDGEFQIGQTWETMQFLSHHGIDNLGIFVDDNGQQCDGRVDTVMKLHPLDQKLTAFGVKTVVIDGHNIEEILRASLVERSGRALAVICKTDPCKDMPVLVKNAPRLHYLRFKNEQEKEEYRKILNEWIQSHEYP